MKGFNRRIHVSFFDVQPPARGAQPGRGAGLRHSESERKYARSIDEEPRAAGLQVQRALLRRSVVGHERADQPEWRSDLQRVLRHEPEEDLAFLREAVEPRAQ